MDAEAKADDVEAAAEVNNGTEGGNDNTVSGFALACSDLGVG
jgi:hypothetical protein